MNLSKQEILDLFMGDFVCIPNDLLRDPDLSVGAKGVLCYLLTFDEDWDFFSEKIMKDNNIGRAKYQRIIRELKDRGFLMKVDKKATNGKYKSSPWKPLTYKLSDIVEKIQEYENKASVKSIETRSRETIPEKNIYTKKKNLNNNNNNISYRDGFRHPVENRHGERDSKITKQLNFDVDTSDQVELSFDRIWKFQLDQLEPSKRKNKTQTKKRFASLAKKEGIETLTNVIRSYYNSFLAKPEKFKYACGLNSVLRDYETHKEAYVLTLGCQGSAAPHIQKQTDAEFLEIWNSLCSKNNYLKKYDPNQVFVNLKSKSERKEILFKAMLDYYSNPSIMDNDAKFMVSPLNFFRSKYLEFIPELGEDGNALSKDEIWMRKHYKVLFSAIDSYLNGGAWMENIYGKNPETEGNRLSQEHLEYFNTKKKERDEKRLQKKKELLEKYGYKKEE